MAKKKIPKHAKRRLTVLTPLVFLAVGYCIFTLVTTAIELYNLHTEETSLKKELNSLKSESSDLKTELNKLQDKDYVARYARENYYYTKDGEYVIKTTDDKTKNKKKNKSTINEEYIMYGGIAVFVLIFLYIIFKHKKKKKRKKA